MTLHTACIALTGHIGVAERTGLELALGRGSNAGREILQRMTHDRRPLGFGGVRVVAGETGCDVVIRRHDRVQEGRLGIHLGVALEADGRRWRRHADCGIGFMLG